MFTKVFSLENPSKTTQAEGSHTETYDHYVTTRGHFRRRSGFRDLQEGYDQLVTEYEAFTFWRSSFDNEINKDTRFIYENQVYKIIEKERYQENRQLMRFILIAAE